MKKLALIFSLLLLSSCATVFPVARPDLSRDEYGELVGKKDPQATCYRRGVRGWTIAADALFFFPLFIDGALGAYTYFYYDPTFCRCESTQKKTVYSN